MCLIYSELTVVNAGGRLFQCEIVDPVPVGFTITSDPVQESCTIRHSSLDYETTQSVSMRVRVRLQGQPWSDVSAPGYHPEATVSHAIDVSFYNILILPEFYWI